jgi:hypothetical protein
MLIRAFGAVAVALWMGLALSSAASWPVRSLFIVGACALVAVAARPIATRAGRALLRIPSGTFVAACALAAAALSMSLVRGAVASMPVAIDAGVYLFQARALAHGHFGAAVPSPATSFGAQFLFEGGGGRLYGVFPPGYPLFLVPFVWAGAPLVAGPVAAALLVVAQYALGRSVGRATGSDDGAEIATRLAILVSLGSFARSIETADLLSHAFVAVLATTALALAISVSQRWIVVVGLGACVGWAFAARLLDGVVLGAVVAAVVGVAQGRRAPKLFAIAALGALPFVGLVAANQKAATGSFTTPTQSEYFARSDWPPTCHRLGFGVDVGCHVEHAERVADDGGDGFEVDDALRVVRERASVLGVDLFGFAPLGLLAFGLLIARPTRADAALAAFALLLTLAYGLFYVGNESFYGARHLFPAAPCLWLLASRAVVHLPGRASGWLDAPHLRGAGGLALLAAALVLGRAPWLEREAHLRKFQSHRPDLRAVIRRHAVDRGILKTHDVTSYVAALDPVVDDDARFPVVDDRSGLLDLRRAHPHVPMFLAYERDEIGRPYGADPPPPGLLFEIERAWPSFQRPHGLEAHVVDVDGASGGRALELLHAAPSASVELPLDVTTSGAYTLRLDARASPSSGDYEITLDGAPLTTVRGYAPVTSLRRGDWLAERPLAAGRHTLVARCSGRDAASSGFDAALDALTGTLADPPVLR